MTTISIEPERQLHGAPEHPILPCYPYVFNLLCLFFFICCFLGLEYREDCRIQSYIPIYLIVFGAFGIFRNVLCLFNKCKEKLTDSETADGEQNPKKSGCTALTDLFLIIWFICGNIWVYGISLPDFNDKNSSDYCNATLYLFAFWLTTSVYIFIGALCTCCCFLGCCAAILSDSDE